MFRESPEPEPGPACESRNDRRSSEGSSGRGNDAESHSRLLSETGVPGEFQIGLGAGEYERRHHTDHDARSEEHTSELQSLMRISYAVFCLKKKNTNTRSKQYAINDKDTE